MSLSYFLKLCTNFAATAQEIRVNPIGNTPLVRTAGILEISIPEAYKASNTGSKTSAMTNLYRKILDSLLFCITCAVIFPQDTQTPPNI